MDMRFTKDYNEYHIAARTESGDGWTLVPKQPRNASDKRLLQLFAYEELGTVEDFQKLVTDNHNLRNELCQKCGRYKEAHKGACNGCRWEKEDAANDK